MKRFMLLMLLSASAVTVAQAQTFSNTGSGTNHINMEDEQEAGPSKKEASNIVYENPSIDQTSMDVQENTLSFLNLPENSMTLHITDANGNELITKKLTKKNSTADITRLKKGMHFVTITSDNTDNRKSFTLNRN